MKKILSVLMAAALCASMAACSSSDNSSSVAENGNIQIDTLRVAFVPSREPDEIITATEPLKEMLKTELAKEGYDVGNVEITVGTSYEAVGESLSAGTADVGLIPGGTYVPVSYTHLVVPILADLNIAQISSIVQILGYLNNLVLTITAMKLPKMFPEAWEKSQFHVPTPVFNTLMIITCAALLLSLIHISKSCGDQQV